MIRNELEGHEENEGHEGNEERTWRMKDMHLSVFQNRITKHESNSRET